MNIAPLIGLAVLLATAVIPASQRAASGESFQQRSDTIVRIAGPPLRAGIGKLVEDLSIGSESAGAEYMFSSLGQMLPLRNGGVIVIDNPASQRGVRGSTRGASFVRQYDANGKFVRNFGRSGEGPGEFRRPEDLAELPDGRIIVMDTRGGDDVLHVYSSGGQPLDDITFDAGFSGPLRTMMGFFADTAGYYYRRVEANPRPDRTPARRGSPPAARGPVINRMLLPAAYERRRVGSTTIDSIKPPLFPTAPRYNHADFSVTLTDGRGGSGGTSTELPYWPDAEWIFSPLGYAITAVPTRYAIDLRIPPAPAGRASRGTADTPFSALWKEGDPVVSIRRNVTPIPVPERERAQARQLITERLQSALPTWSWRGSEIPRTKPAFDEMRVTLDGRIWVRVAQPSVVCASCQSGYQQAIVYDIFEPSGLYLGQLGLDKPLDVRAPLRGDYVWGSVADANGVRTVKRWRITWPGGR